MATERRLSPGAIARTLFGLDPDRDERASQLCMETLLTLANNGYSAPADVDRLRGPKRRAFAVRSLALSKNFLELDEQERIGADGLTPHAYGAALARGDDLLGSANLALAREALSGLVDPSTQTGQPGGHLLRPFHESLLWFDARQSSGKPWGVRQVYMRGSGVTLARMLVGPGPEAGDEATTLGTRAVAAIREALRSPTPLGEIAETLERPLADYQAGAPQPEETKAWMRGAQAELAPLAQRICRHVEGVMLQGTASAPAKLWQLRTILALDLATHALRTAWDCVGHPDADRVLLLCFDSAPRRDNRVRQRSERTYDEARQRLRQATVTTLARELRDAAATRPDWGEELESRRGNLDEVIEQLKQLSESPDPGEFERIALLAADAADYGRAAEGFRVLLDTVGVLTGTGAYRYLSATPDLMAALVGALSAKMPMTSAEFFDAVQAEWDLAVRPVGGRLAREVDGAEFERNARRAEALLADAGLALGLSDRTVIVGERAERSVTA